MNTPNSFRIPLGISRVRGEEDEIGHAEIDRTRFVAGIVNTLTDFGHRCDRTGWTSVGEQLADYYKPRLTGDLYAWLSRYVEYQYRVEAMTADQFLGFIKQERWDPALLCVPAVQQQVEQIRRFGNSKRHV